MKAVIFAGGIGTRLWPVSRKKSPKQFQEIVGNKSTLQLTVDRLFPEFSPEDIYISTGSQYIDTVRQQLPQISPENIIGEPVMRDVGPSVCFMMGYLSKKAPNEPVIILWSDHLIKDVPRFKHLMHVSSEAVKAQNKGIVFIGHKPRFASENLGWISTGETQTEIEDVQVKTFEGLCYRPSKEAADHYFKSMNHCWNIGYFTSTPHYIYSLFQKHAPEVFNLCEEILKTYGTDIFTQTMNDLYPKMKKISFDNAVLEKINPKEALVIVDDIGWSDVGAWEALKEALEENQSDNITKGNVQMHHSSDNLIYNYEDKKLIVGVDLDDILVVNTKDAILVARKSSVSNIKQVVEGFNGTDLENLT